MIIPESGFSCIMPSALQARTLSVMYRKGARLPDGPTDAHSHPDRPAPPPGCRRDRVSRPDDRNPWPRRGHGGSRRVAAGITFGSTVSPAAPFPDPEPHEISPRFVKNIAEYGEGVRPLVTIHDATYTLRYQSRALAADVVKAPFLVTFTVTPGSTNPNYCSFILTIRDADSGTVVGQEGYTRTFSTDTTKKLAFLKPGRYHLTLHGAMVDVRLRLQAGE